MKNKIQNSVHLEGYIYQHTLEERVTGPNSKNPGTHYISGNLDIATDDALLNIVTVHYSYVTPKTARGTDNLTYNMLQDIITGRMGSVMNDGIDKAAKVRIDSTLDCNEFYSDRNGPEELVSAKRNEGGFIHKQNDLDMNPENRNRFHVDMVITKIKDVEENEERQIPAHNVVTGYVFDFRKNLKPVEFIVYDKDAMNYFSDRDRCPVPSFQEIKGQVVSTTVKRTIEVEGAFSVDVREVSSTRKEYVATWAQPYLWDDESTITEEELKTAIQNREVELAALKRRNDEYKASRNTASAPPSAVATGFSSGEFNF